MTINKENFQNYLDEIKADEATPDEFLIVVKYPDNVRVSWSGSNTSLVGHVEVIKQRLINEEIESHKKFVYTEADKATGEDYSTI